MKRTLNTVENLSFKLTRSIGTPTSVIVHSLLFIGIFSLHWFGFPTSDILLILTTAVSLEAIYLSIFIQMSINRTTENLEEVSEDVEEIAKDVDELQEDVEGIEGNVQEIAKDVEDIDRDVDEIAKDIDEIQEDVQGIEDEVEDISKDIDEIQEDDKKEENAAEVISKMEDQLHKIMEELQTLKNSPSLPRRG